MHALLHIHMQLFMKFVNPEIPQLLQLQQIAIMI